MISAKLVFCLEAVMLCRARQSNQEQILKNSNVGLGLSLLGISFAISQTNRAPGHGR